MYCKNLHALSLYIHIYIYIYIYICKELHILYRLLLYIFTSIKFLYNTEIFNLYKKFCFDKIYVELDEK